MVPAPKERRMGINVLVRLAAFPGLKSVQSTPDGSLVADFS
jgi:hypothetical protein